MSRLIRMDQTGHTTLAEWSADDPVAELRALREAVEAIRGELAALRQRDPGALSSVLGDRVENVLVRAEAVAGRIPVTAPANGRTNGGRRNGH